MDKKYQKTLIIIFIVIMLIIVCGATFAYLSLNINSVGNYDVNVKTKDIDIFNIDSLSNAIIDANDMNFGPQNGANQTSSAEIAVSLETSKDKAEYCYDVKLFLPPQKRNLLTSKVDEYLLNDLNTTKTKMDLEDEFNNNICMNSGEDFLLSNELSNILCSIDKDNFNETICSNNISKSVLNIENIKNDYCNSILNYTPDPISGDVTPELVLNVYKSNNNGNYEKVIDNMDITTKVGTLNVPVSLNSSNYKNIITASANNKTIVNWKAEVTLVWLDNRFQENIKEKKYQATLEVSRIDC